MFTLITKDGCNYCEKARIFLSQKKIEYKVTDHAEVNIDTIKKSTMHTTFPFIFLDGEFIGGYDEMRMRFSTGEIPRRLGLIVEHCDF